MRVTDSIITRNLLDNINSSRENMNKYQLERATGKKLQKVSDNPVDFTKANRFKETLVKNSQYVENITIAKGWTDNAMAALDGINEGLITAKELAIRGSDKMSTESTWNTFADQVDNILKEAIALGNSSFMGNSLFSGNKTDERKPFQYDGVNVGYFGNSKDITRRIADNYDVKLNIDGAQFINADLFENLIKLRNAFQTGDIAQMTTSIDELEISADKIVLMNTSMGSIKNQLETTEYRIEVADINIKSYLSQTEDADLASSITNYNAEETAYKAALEATSNAINLNILNFIR